jgi:glutathione S-transferase
MGQGNEELKKLNPNLKIPVVTDGDLVLYESAAICHYIASAKAKPGVLMPEPSNVEAMAKYFQWLFYGMSELDAAMWMKSLHQGRTSLPREYVNEDAARAGEYLFFERCKTIDQELSDGRPYLLGDQFSAADIIVGQTLFWSRSQKMENPGQHVVAYRNRLKARPAFERVVAQIKK